MASDTTLSPASSGDGLVERARAFAIDAHRGVGQLRKYTGQPYEEHLRRVAEIVAGVSDDGETIAAAWLHDIVEDTPVTIEDVGRTFGPGVRELVDALTDVSRPHHGNRAARKALDREHLAHAPARAQTVKLADLIDNCQDICRHSPGFGRVFLKEMAEVVAVLTQGDATLHRRAAKTMERWSSRLGKASAPTAAGSASPRMYAGTDVRNAARVVARAFNAADIAQPMVDAPNPAAVATTQRVDARAGLANVVLALSRHDRCIVDLPGGATGFVDREAMQGAVGRMWLFGIITAFELALTEGIRAVGDTVDWAPLLTPARLAKARALQEERAALGRSVPLLDCLQLTDKARITLSISDRPWPILRGNSKAESQRLVRDLEALRNSLAHAQDIVTHDWAQIARLAQRVEELAEG
jgi:hypothetical protein